MTKKHPDGFVLVKTDDEVIGQLELQIKNWNNTRIGYVNLYYIVEKYRGKGFGKILHKYAIDFFKKHEVKEYHLRVSPTNQKAINFYKQNGMVKAELERENKVIRMVGIVSQSPLCCCGKRSSKILF